MEKEKLSMEFEMKALQSKQTRIEQQQYDLFNFASSNTFYSSDYQQQALDQ